MCGICCIISLRCQRDVGSVPVCSAGSVERASLYQALRRRGPDAFASLHFDIGSNLRFDVASAVLSMRGSACFKCGEAIRNTASQPAFVVRESDIVKNTGVSCFDGLSSCESFLLWNGEVFGGLLHLPIDACDTTAVLSRFSQLECKCAAELPENSDECYAVSFSAAQEMFSKLCVKFLEEEIEGPYAFVYYASSLRLFLFGRDPLGRRSLLTHLTAILPSDGESDGEGLISQGVVLEVAISSIAGRHLDATGVKETSAKRSNKRCRCEKCDKTGGCGDNNDATHFSDICCSSVFSLCCCWQEVSNGGIFAISVAPFLEGPFMLLYPWTIAHSTHPLLRFRSLQEQLIKEEGLVTQIGGSQQDNKDFVVLQRLLVDCEVCFLPLLKSSTSFEIDMTKRYLTSLWKSVSVRVKTENCGGDPTRPVGVLFSGGIDCTVIAAIAHYVLPFKTPIELINVAFGDDPELAPDRVATFKAFEQLLQLPKFCDGNDAQEFDVSYREWRLVLVDVPFGAEVPHIQTLVHPGNSVIDMSIGTALWHAAQGRGRMQRVFACDEVASKLSTSSSFCNKHRLYRVSREDNSDCPFVPKEMVSTEGDAKGEDKFAPLIDAVISEVETFGGVPTSPVLLSTLGKDHATVLRPILLRYGYKKLGQYLNDAFAAGMITFAKSFEASSKAICLVRAVDLARVRCVTPARWLTSNEHSAPLGLCVEDYTSQARVLLLGIGADETLGGYTRHRRAFERGGAQGLADELDLDFARLWKRNLGRDDRVVSDSGREGRYPYLDEGVLATLGSIAAEAHRRASAQSIDANSAAAAPAVDVGLREALLPVCCFTPEDGPPGVGDKKILRRCAAMLGLGDVAWLQKRAIQFGSRVAYASF